MSFNIIKYYSHTLLLSKTLLGMAAFFGLLIQILLINTLKINSVAFINLEYKIPLIVFR